MQNRTFKTLIKNGRKFNLLTLPGTNYFNFEIINMFGSNIERIYQQKTGKNVYGIAHLIEHLAFKSTKDYTTAQLINIKKSEGICNASTNYDRVNYWFETVMEKKEKSIKFVCNIALNDLSKITQKEFDIEKKVVFNEAKRYVDDDQTMFYFNSTGALAGYDKEDNIIGLPKTIETFTLEDAIAIKNIFLNHDKIVYNVTFDSELCSEEEILCLIEKELDRFKTKEKASVAVSNEEYLQHIKYPQIGDFKVDNEAEQVMTLLNFDAVKNILISSSVCSYLSKLAEETSLDDLIRQKNGLTYGVYMFSDTISYKPYITFACDVSKGSEEKLMELFKESIGKSLENWDEIKHKKFIQTAKLKRTMQLLDQKAYTGWFDICDKQEEVLDDYREDLAKNIDMVYEKIDNELITYENMRDAMEKLLKLIQNEKFGKVSNL